MYNLYNLILLFHTNFICNLLKAAKYKVDFVVSQLIDRTHVSSFSRRDVFPQGLPDEYAFVTTFKFRKTSRREDWYLWQVFDKYGIPQVGQPIVDRS